MITKIKSSASVSKVEDVIITIRGQRVVIDSDLAKLYGTQTKRLNEQVKRKKMRFPSDFMFQLSEEEKCKVVANCDHLKNLKYSKILPYAFTEHGTIMVANVLNSQIAIDSSVLVVRAFIRAREIISEHADLKRKLEGLERKITKKLVSPKARLLFVSSNTLTY